MNRVTQNNLKAVPMTSKLQKAANGKTVMAIVLVSVMGLLWGRVLLTGKSGPASAAAQDVQPTEQAAAPVSSPEKVVSVELSIIEGRHDVLCGDMFSTDNWRAFDLNKDSAGVSVSQSTSETRHQANLRKIAETLKLEAIIHDTDGKPYQVFVNDAILTVGSVLTVKEGPDEYKLELRRISENEAMFVWDKTSITLKMTEMVEK